jgi:hypothetical protein
VKEVHLREAAIVVVAKIKENAMRKHLAHHLKKNYPPIILPRTTAIINEIIEIVIVKKGNESVKEIVTPAEVEAAVQVPTFEIKGVQVVVLGC